MTYTKVVLTVIAMLLAALVMRPAPVHADTDLGNLYVEPGTSPIRNLNGGVPGDGKVVINMSTGEVWGFPTQSAGAPYPIDTMTLNNKPPVSKPVYLGKFDFAPVRRGH
jgi:hypothetical protein